jgi:hypothetical protein
MSKKSSVELEALLIYMAIGYFIAKMLKDAGMLPYPKKFAKLIEEAGFNIAEMKPPLESRN